MTWGGIIRVTALLALCSALGGCFFYDSNWGQAKASQKRVAAQRMPSALRAEGKVRSVATAPPDRLKIRAYATPRYAAALVNGQDQFEQALADANPTLVADLSFRLELESYRPWPHGGSEEDLGALLDGVRAVDPAEDVDWVVVLVGPLRMVALSPDQLGVGQFLGRHLALRAISDPDELEAIDRSFAELSEAERHKLYAARKRHKAAAVLLHELGHTLGMPHELERTSMMSTRYHEKASAFSSHGARLGRRALELRATELGSEAHRNAARAALNVLDSAPEHTWEPASAASLAQLFRRHAEASPRATSQPRALAPSAEPDAVAQLSAPDAALFARARAEQAASRFREARSLAAPLFERYPDVLQVQELRCQLAMKVGLSMSDERAECARLAQLAGGGLL
jgi:hypothetical protein